MQGNMPQDCNVRARKARAVVHNVRVSGARRMNQLVSEKDGVYDCGHKSVSDATGCALYEDV